MQAVPGAATFDKSGAAYDGFMGRYSKPLAVLFSDFSGVVPGKRALDLGCGPGALTRVLVDRLGVDSVLACDPSESFVGACAKALPGLDVRLGRAEAIPFPDASVDLGLSQLVLHFVSDPTLAITEMRRVVRPGGTIAACVWDFDKEMEMLRHFWDAALSVDKDAPDEARVLKFGREGEISGLFEASGLHDVVGTRLEVEVGYGNFDELWAGFMAGIGPAGSYCVALDDTHRSALREDFFRRCGSPAGGFSLKATARSAKGTTGA